MFVTLTSPDKRYDSLFLANYGVINLQNELARAARRRQRHGLRRRPATPCASGWIPNQLQARGLTPRTSSTRSSSRARKSPPASIGMPPVAGRRELPVHGQRHRPLQRRARLREHRRQGREHGGGRITRVKDIGRVELGAQTYSQTFTYNGPPAAGIGIFQLPDANALTVAKAVARQDGRSSPRRFPAGPRLHECRSTPPSSSRRRSRRSTRR